MRWIDRPTGTGFGGLWVVDALKISIEDTQDGTDGRDTISLCSVGYSLCDYSHRNNRSTRNHQLKIPFRKAPRGCKPKKLRNEPQRFQHGVTQIIEFDWKPCACIGVLELSWQARPASPFRSMGGWWQRDWCLPSLDLLLKYNEDSPASWASIVVKEPSS
ncbi:hypothetical protein M430DRAFT_33035 [Amorphotheca resinae ATCC 22711]|uniref:Uncharacterized protein n=1 Tax=Amorphotheca resinae ATCC 22711 TaxID=857342 RepID=A0A2T3BAA9_AMORE|nr:hypothetical protein M430DRAFT_33035 [Amorphotheca resinae ATCC 22711]PSS25262.1 hypothetical protein M430DRAFT_33035 [Amorphotheca resinae ATCC 22711]